MSALKQPGRKYGPAPKQQPHEGMQAPKPKYALLDALLPRAGAKGKATPKQKKVRR